MRSGIGAVLAGSTAALLYLNGAAWFDLPGEPAVWVVGMGGTAGLAGALLMRYLDRRPQPPQPMPTESGIAPAQRADEAAQAGAGASPSDSDSGDLLPRRPNDMAQAGAGVSPPPAESGELSPRLPEPAPQAALQPALQAALQPALQAEPGVPWQVNRLFIFNTLHNAAAQTVADPERARTVIEKFAEYIRIVHELNQNPVTLLNLEIHCARIFLAIERLRFGDRLRVSEEVAEECLETAVPSLMLQPLVAYAIRSGVEQTAAAVQVTLKAWQSGAVTVLEVWHDGPGETDPGRRERLTTELGFSELIRTLRERYGEGVAFDITENEPMGECLRIRLRRGGAAG